MTNEAKSIGGFEKRLREILPQVELVRELCQVPSISLGVLHDGKTFCHSTGYRGPEMIEKVGPDTIYMLGSCSKMFTSAALGILVDSQKVHWQDAVRKFLRNFHPAKDPQIGENADFIDLLRHSSGLGEVGRLCLGPHGSILVDEADLLPLLNLMPTSNEKGQRFNREWAYNNVAYGIISQVVEQISDQRFDGFVRDRILKPLGMTRTIMTRAEIGAETDVAIPCVTLENGQFVQLDFEDWPCEHVSPLLAAAGIRSSINDMLEWCKAVLSAERQELCNIHGQKYLDLSTSATHLFDKNNPLKQMNRIRRGYWTRPADDPSTSKSAAYCMGWVRLDLPSSMLGAFSGNVLSREKSSQDHLMPEFILGKSSESLLAIGHSGGMPGSLATIWTFPKTGSAVVVLTNGRGVGDASDFVAQILIQELFDLKPKVDLIPWVRHETKLARGYFRERMLVPWKQSRSPNDSIRDPEFYVGDSGDLCVIFNKRRASMCSLTFFSRDIYSYFIPDFDRWIRRGIAVSKLEQTLLEFKFNEAKEVATGLWWLWNSEEEREYFKKVM